MDTISAIATPSGEGGIGIVRISGDGAIAVASAMFRAASGVPLSGAEPYTAHYGRVVSGDGSLIDEAIALVMRAPRSYTAEDVVEIQCHGGRAALSSVLSRSYECGARPAERGEFTKRAFLNGRLDLSEAEAVMDIVGAKTSYSLQMAVGRLSGKFSGRIKELRRRILELIARLEAAIDFPEDDIDDVVMLDARLRIEEITAELEKILGTAKTGKILREGLRVAIIGRPNVGKSSLLNALLREDRAIVTASPGTTRDAIEEYADVLGVPVRIVDTAGIRESDDEAERIGVSRARENAASAALVLAVMDSSAQPSDGDREILSLASGKDFILVMNKSDLARKFSDDEIEKLCPGARPVFISAKTGDGLDALERGIAARAARSRRADEEIAANEREADIIRRAIESLRIAAVTANDGNGADFVTIDLRAALDYLGEITGETAGDEVIEEIFSKFCIGK